MSDPVPRLTFGNELLRPNAGSPLWRFSQNRLMHVTGTAAQRRILEAAEQLWQSAVCLIYSANSVPMDAGKVTPPELPEGNEKSRTIQRTIRLDSERESCQGCVER